MPMDVHRRPVAGLLLVLAAGCGGQGQPSTGQQGSAAEPEQPFTSTVESRTALALASYWQPVPDDGVELGLGWDSRESRVVPNRCVRMAPVHSPGQTAVMSLEEMSSRSQVMRALNLSAAASVKTMFASGSATASFARTTSTSSQTTTLLMNATITNGTLFAGPADAAAVARSAFPASGVGGDQHNSAKDTGKLTLHPWALALLKKPEEFRAYCGDGYVSAITSGARLLASFEITGSSATERQTTAASIKGSYGPANFSGSANASSGSETAMQNVSVRYMQVGGAKGAIATSTAELRDKLKTLAGEAFESPRFQDMRVTPYAQMAEVRNNAGWREADDEYGMIADTYWQLTSLEDDVRYILANYQTKDAQGKETANYVTRTGRDVAGLKAFLDDILQVRRAIHAALNGAAQDREEQPAQAAPVALFAPPPAQTALRAPSGINLAQLRGSRDLGTLAAALDRALPYGNPAVLLLNLPLPASEGSGQLSDQELRKAVVDYYLVPIAHRACRQDPNDRSCFSEGELEQIAVLVPLRPAG